MASIEDLNRQNLDITTGNLKLYDRAESDLMAQIRAMLATQDSMLKHEAALNLNGAAAEYGAAGGGDSSSGGGSLAKAYYLTQRENPAAILTAMQQLAQGKQGFATARVAENRAQQAGDLQAIQLQLQKEQLKGQEASTLEKIMAGVGSIGSIAAMAFSTKDAKKNIKKTSPKKLLEDIKSIEIKEYEYKPGMGPMGKHVGMIIEENPQEFEPGQKAVDIQDLYSFVSKLAGAVQALDEKMQTKKA